MIWINPELLRDSSVEEQVTFNTSLCARAMFQKSYGCMLMKSIINHNSSLFQNSLLFRVLTEGKHIFWVSRRLATPQSRESLTSQ